MTQNPFIEEICNLEAKGQTLPTHFWTDGCKQLPTWGRLNNCAIAYAMQVNVYEFIIPF